MTHTPEHMDGLRYSAELVEMVNDEARRTARLRPWLRPWARTLAISAVAAALVAWVLS